MVFFSFHFTRQENKILAAQISVAYMEQQRRVLGYGFCILAN